jgi:hypothetical protein
LPDESGASHFTPAGYRHDADGNGAGTLPDRSYGGQNAMAMTVSGARSAFPKNSRQCSRLSAASGDRRPTPSGCRRLRGMGTPPDQIRGKPCPLLRINHPPNCAPGRFMSACSPKTSNRTRYGNTCRLSRPNWTRRRTLSKLPQRLMMSDAVTA